MGMTVAEKILARAAGPGFMTGRAGGHASA
jgi:hypothetical protein